MNNAQPHRLAVFAGLLLTLMQPHLTGAQDEISIVASESGFRPAFVKLHRGETVRLVLKTADEEHCFAVDALRIEKRIAKGRATVVELTPDRVAEFPFYCCLEPDNAALRGKLVVVE